MNSIRCKNGGMLLIATVAGIFSLISGSVPPAEAFPSSIQTNQDRTATAKSLVAKGKEPIDILATVVAMSREQWDGPGVGQAFEILLLRVEKVTGESNVPAYVRVDFDDLSSLENSTETKAYLQLLRSLREPKLWKIHLRPPRGTGDCWAVPPPPIPGDLMSSRNPVIVPVGGASGYPDVNTAPCYIADQRDIQEVASPEKPDSQNRK